MKKLLFVVFGLLCLTFPIQALAADTTWLVDEDHTASHFAVEHMGLTMVRGSINDVKGKMVLSDDQNHRVQLDLIIDPFSLFTGINKRDHHLLSPDFLDAAKYPAITFVSTATSAAGKGELNLTGNLTIHGITKEVTLLFTGPTEEVTDPWGNRRRGGKITGILKTADFGLNWNKPMPNGKSMVIGENIEVTLDLEVGIPAEKKQ
ncbi:MAG: YceI family protein [Proteobacteria bacterium]|nr:YceI family protein [Pseudomonadota bacterium]MBU1739652.1 YceI family protein [Pseudomonadota bacterium]